MKKKLLAIILIIALAIVSAIVLTACGDKSPAPDTTTPTTPTTPTDPTTPTTPTDPTTPTTPDDLAAALNLENLLANLKNFKQTESWENEDGEVEESIFIFTENGYHYIGFNSYKLDDGSTVRQEKYCEFGEQYDWFYELRNRLDGRGFVWTKYKVNAQELDERFDGYVMLYMFVYYMGLTPDDFTKVGDWYVLNDDKLLEIYFGEEYTEEEAADFLDRAGFKLKLSGDKVIEYVFTEDTDTITTLTYGGQVITFPEAEEVDDPWGLKPPKEEVDTLIYGKKYSLETVRMGKVEMSAEDFYAEYEFEEMSFIFYPDQTVSFCNEGETSLCPYDLFDETIIVHYGDGEEYTVELTIIDGGMRLRSVIDMGSIVTYIFA